ncbi:hypothetical protein FOA52_003368 [Chlamydomonas sp. UWO 241]|nr:hypothetical protein FOA52_003368 [Chlamydomonas sp. UWO 241]
MCIVIKNWESLARASALERKVLSDFFKMAQKVQEFIKEVIEQSWLAKMVAWPSTKGQVESLECKMNNLTTVLQLTASLGTYTKSMEVFSILKEAEQEHVRIDQLVADVGGPEELMNDDVALQCFIGQAGGIDGMQLAILRSIKAMMGAIVADKGVDEGPHKIIDNEKIKALWHDCFSPSRTVTWQGGEVCRFFAVFPVRLPLTSPAEIALLVAERKEPDEREKFKFACDTDTDGVLSVEEITKAFPSDVDVLDSVRSLKSASLLWKGVHYALPALPQVFVGRDSEVAAVFRCISGGESGGRVSLVRGQPGESKATVATKAIRQVYEGGHARGGVWLVRLAGVTTKDELRKRVVGGISELVRPTDKKQGIAASLSSRLAEMNKSGIGLLVLFDDCEDLLVAAPVDGKSLHEEFVELVVRIVRDVPKMRLVLTSCRDFATCTVQARVTEVSLGPLSEGDCVSLITGIWDKASTVQAHAIMDCFGRTPLMLQIIANIIADGEMDLKQALGSGGMSALADGNMTVEAAMGKVQQSIMRSLNTFDADMRMNLLKIAMVLPGNFDYEILRSVLDMQLDDGKKLFLSLNKWNLLSETSQDQVFRLTPTIREASINICKDAKKAKGLGIALTDAWIKFLQLCVELARADFQQYRKSPVSAYSRIVENKGNVQQALRLAVQQFNVAKACRFDMLHPVAVTVT